MSGLVVAVEQQGAEWVATCDHGGEVWVLHRGTKYLAQRSLSAHIKHEHLVHRDVCACFWTPPETWLSAASCGYGSGYEPGSQMEWNPECPVHIPHPTDLFTSEGAT
jgi:hypothetical protein